MIKQQPTRDTRPLPSLPATADANIAGPEYDLSEPTMEEKLAALNLPSDDADGGAEEEEQAAAAVAVVPPSADSVHVLLRQALRADDRAALLGCLCNRDDKVRASKLPFFRSLSRFLRICNARSRWLVTVLFNYSPCRACQQI
jgi:hypothetical protein